MTARTGEILLAILREQLGNDDLGPDDDFYAAGGDSIVALRVVTAAAGQGVAVELIDLLYHPTPRELAAALEHRAPRPEAPAPAGAFSLLDAFDRALLPAGVSDAWPASALQVGLIYLCERSGDPALYHDLIGVRVLGPFDEGRFAAALSELCDRHPALRSSFDLGTFAEPVQLVWPHVTPPLTVRHDPGPDPVADWREAELARTVDWRTAPAFRCHVAVVDGGFELMVAIHHAIIDGWSLSTALTELLVLYDGALRDQPVDLPPQPAGGHPLFVAAERSAAESPESARFWLTQAGDPVLVERERFTGPADPTATLSFPVDTALLSRLRNAAHHAGVPLKSLALGCHAWALGKLTGRERDLVTGLTVNGRPEVDGADRLVGLYLNNIPLRLPTVAGDCLDVAREALLAEQRVLPHRRYPLNHIENLLGRPAFDVLFNFTHFHPYRELDRLAASSTASWWSFDKASLPMTVDFMIESRRFGTAVAASYDPDLLPTRRVQTFLDLYLDALHHAADSDG